MEKSGKISGSSMRWIFGLIIVLIIIGGIIALTRDTAIPENPAKQQIGEVNLTEGQAQAGNPNNKNLTVHFLDVGQGDSILLEYNGKAMLIDAGEQDQGTKISEYLRDHGISALDYVVATHPHADHIGGMAEILNNFPVNHFIDSGFPHTSKTYENMLTTIDEKNIPFEVAKKGEKIEFDPALDIEVLNPDPQYSQELNENSVVLKVSYSQVSFLFMGDAGLDIEQSLMDSGYELDSDILKVGHHASKSGSGEAFISQVSPGISIIEVGAGNDYGHPNAEVLRRLESVSRVYRTDLDGTVVITTDGSIYTVRTEKAGGTKPEGNSVPGSSGLTESTVYLSELNLKEEWVKLSNKGPAPVSLKGWKIKDEGNKNIYTIPSYTLNSGTTLTLYTGKGKNSATEMYWGSNSPVWNNDGDKAYLYNDNGELVSTLEG
ncbi:MAG TPA: lamin tail domain-containing protein [Methanosarcina sp.]|nr:lamin tail domain-containing protein [Methanosarcina sp.]